MTSKDKRNRQKTIVSLGAILGFSGFIVAYLEYKYFDASMAFGFALFLVGWVLVVMGIIIDRLQNVD